MRKPGDKPGQKGREEMNSFARVKAVKDFKGYRCEFSGCYAQPSEKYKGAELCHEHAEYAREMGGTVSDSELTGRPQYWKNKYYNLPARYDPAIANGVRAVERILI
jgi:hypothetical protein